MELQVGFNESWRGVDRKGGHEGRIEAGRDAVEFILEAKGILDKVIEEYIDERNPISPSMDIGRGCDLS